MKNFLIIADIAGQYDALQRLVAMVPSDTIKISVGDMCDRGPQSKEVFEYFMDGYGVDKLAILGNHEHMLMYHYGRTGDKYRFYDHGTWHWNGGGPTQKSFPDEKVTKEVLDWLDDLPVCIEIEGPTNKLFISHAAWLERVPFCPEELDDATKFELIWNRGAPTYREGYMQILGHNSHWGLEEFRTQDGTPFALCIDQSRTKKLTGYLYPECKVIEVPYEVDQTPVDPECPF